MKSSPAITSFNAGELGPTLAARVDLQKYPNGAERMENFIPLVQGPAQRRGGTRFVAPVKTHSQRVWLRRFEFSATQHFILEFGHQYIRFYTQHGQVLSGGQPYEIASPYTLSDLTNAEGAFALSIEQSGDVLYIASRNHEPRTLTRLSDTNWVMAVYRPDNGPFDEQNIDQERIVVVTGQEGTVTVNANANIFTSTDVGRLLRVEVQNFDVPPWEPDSVDPVNVGDIRRYDGKTYKALNSDQTGITPPIHTSGIASDGKVFWEYQDCGYGVMRIDQVITATQVTGTVLARMPDGVNGPGVWPSITGITNANPAVVTAPNHLIAEGENVYISGVVGMTEVNNRFFRASNVSTNTFELAGVNSTNFGTYLNGGTAVPRATTRWSLGAWSQTTGYPTAVAFAYDRLWWARGIDIWGSVPAKYDDMGPDVFGVVTPDSAISAKVTAQDVNEILWLVEAERLIIGTPGGEFALGPITTVDPVGPENVQIKRQSKKRCRSVRPQIIGTSIVYVQRAGRRLLLLDYDFTRERYSSINQNALNVHITRSGIVDMAYQAEPNSTLWCVLADGSLVAFTIDLEQDVVAWHRHPIGGHGIVESVECVPDPAGDRDEVWIVVRRTIGGATRRYVEYIERPWERGDDPRDVFYVDSGLSYSGSPATTISGLSHLAGATVQVCADGAAHPDRVVSSGGQIALDRPASRVHVGFACPARLVTMRLEAGAADGTSQGRIKRITSAVIRFLDTLGGAIGLEGRHLTPLQFRKPSMPMDQPPEIFTGDYSLVFGGDYEPDCRIEIQQNQPLPMTVVGIFPSMRTYEQRK